MHLLQLTACACPGAWHCQIAENEWQKLPLCPLSPLLVCLPTHLRRKQLPNFHLAVTFSHYCGQCMCIKQWRALQRCKAPGVSSELGSCFRLMQFQWSAGAKGTSPSPRPCAGPHPCARPRPGSRAGTGSGPCPCPRLQQLLGRPAAAGPQPGLLHTGQRPGCGRRCGRHPGSPRHPAI